MPRLLRISLSPAVLKTSATATSHFTVFHAPRHRTFIMPRVPPCTATAKGLSLERELLLVQQQQQQGLIRLAWLRALKYYRDYFNYKIGFSDFSLRFATWMNRFSLLAISKTCTLYWVPIKRSIALGFIRTF